MADPAGTIYRVALNCSHDTGATITNLFTFRAETGTGNNDSLFTSISDAFFGVARGRAWQACNVAYTHLNNVTIDTWTIETGTVPAPKVYSAGLPVSGSRLDWPGAGFHTPALLAQHAILRTATSGRSFRGRLYFGPTNLIGDGGLSAPADGWRWHAAMVAFFQVFLDVQIDVYTAHPTTPTWSWGVWSRRLGGNLRSGRYVNTPPYHAAGFTPIVSATAQRGIRTQKRREAPRGV